MCCKNPNETLGSGREMMAEVGYNQVVMKVLIAENCGFCPGVRNAIGIARQTLRQRQNVYSLGPIIHNDEVVAELEGAGLKIVESVDQIPLGTVIIRSHGATLEELGKIREKGLQIVDATCVLVKKVQGTVRELHEQGYLVLVIGDTNHPEVRAIVGSAPEVVVVADRTDLHKLPFNRKLGVVCQTTESPEFFGAMLDAISQRGFSEMRVINTLCKEAIKRQRSAVDLCRKVDVMFVLGGLQSANTRKLAELCKKHNRQTFHLQSWKEFDKSTVLDKETAGVTAGASTPDRVVEEFVRNLEAL
ncbi:MAG: 4-hydroxy-3-methylbut-2-enyl diphosphate reductase [Planctomycetota bacterium]